MKFLINFIIILLILIVIILSGSFLYRIYFSPSVIADVAQENKITKNEVIQVEILNSLQKNGLASAAMVYLRNRKFDVVKIGNFNEKDKPKSFIIDRLGDSLSSKKLAYVLGIADSMIITDIDSSLFLRCTIVLGNDYQHLNPFK